MVRLQVLNATSHALVTTTKRVADPGETQFILQKCLPSSKYCSKCTILYVRESFLKYTVDKEWNINHMLTI